MTDVDGSKVYRPGWVPNAIPEQNVTPTADTEALDPPARPADLSKELTVPEDKVYGETFTGDPKAREYQTTFNVEIDSDKVVGDNRFPPM